MSFPWAEEYRYSDVVTTSVATSSAPAASTGGQGL
jgi:hypothetical protein